jgi:hypothetical protein
LSVARLIFFLPAKHAKNAKSFNKTMCVKSFL